MPAHGHALLHIDTATSLALAEEVSRGNTVLRPGWVRLNFNYFLDDASFDYILSAVELIAEHGWRLLSQYRYVPASGTWIHRGEAQALPVSLHDFDSLQPSAEVVHACATPLVDCLAQARKILLSAEPDTGAQVIALDARAEKMRWFYLPQTG